MDRKKIEDYVPPDVRDDEEIASDAYQNICDDAVNRARTKASKIEVGAPGECSFCGSNFPRVVDRVMPDGENVQACGKCRDDNKLG